jgi:protein-tyrosine phosphatase
MKEIVAHMAENPSSVPRHASPVNNYAWSRLRLCALCLFAAALSGCANRSKPFTLVPVSPGIYVGYKPRTQAQFDTLRTNGIQTILSIETLPWDVWPERHRAQRAGIAFRNVPIFASPLEPNPKRVKQAILTLHDSSLHPVYFHCLLGRDRCAMIIALYRVYYEDWTPESAWDEMLRSGFKRGWGLYGFETYFWRACKSKPKWVTRTAQRQK